MLPVFCVHLDCVFIVKECIYCLDELFAHLPLYCVNKNLSVQHMQFALKGMIFPEETI